LHHPRQKQYYNATMPPKKKRVKQSPPPGPSREELKLAIYRLLPTVHLEKTGVKAFLQLLQQELPFPKARMVFVKRTLTDAVNELLEAAEAAPSSDEEDVSSEEGNNKSEEKELNNSSDSPGSDNEDDDDDDDNDDDSEPMQKKMKKKKKKRSVAVGRGLSVKKELSPELASFLGQEMASRTEVVKLLWNYIKEHDLQNPENKREILLDEQMKQVFGVDVFTMFTMNKYVAAHIHPFRVVDLTSSSLKKRPTGTRKRKADTLATTSPTLGKKKRKPKKPGLQPPYQLSSELAAVVGKDVLPRPQVVAAIWDYIKHHGLQVRISVI
jgi:upstream activation factor subunit UAF30